MDALKDLIRNTTYLKKHHDPIRLGQHMSQSFLSLQTS
ncbi:hypothetical protein KP77_33160 [Jeotgalibacillus alimentarius]|uniref:Uncharacterized protein n=1 Tax=Jeotgalibacillus alimentarius TaxID=135826 RepID=A0A0C2QZX6_9BACL|nr:hypothetical protein KP77_33160 [Jeotgalibacillus alimentarius]